MPNKVKPVPDGYYTVTPYMVVKGAAKALEFYKKAFGAEEIYRMDGPNGTIGHAEIQIGNSRIMMSDEFPMAGASYSPVTLKGTTMGIFLYLENVDAAFKKAVDAGCKVEMPLANRFWGDRYGKLTDPFGHQWSLGSHVEDVSPEEMKKRAKEAIAQMAAAAAKN